jgi:hypothetical protein
MGLLSSIGSAISGGFSAVGGAISSACGSIGSALSSFSASVGTVLGGLVSALAPAAEAISKFANTLLQGLGILKPDENIEDLGDRALQAIKQGTTMDQFDNFDDYMAVLRDFKLNPELSEQISKAEKLVAGLGVGTVGVEDKFNAERGSLNGMWLLPIANSDYFTPERMQTIISSGRLGGDVFAYLEKRLSGSETRNIEKSFEINLDGSPMDKTEVNNLYDALDDARSNWGELIKQVSDHHEGKTI